MNDLEFWPFDLPCNAAVVTARQILEGKEAILFVSHDQDDHGWQFLGGSGVHEDDARVVSLQSLVELDPTITELSDLPPGWSAFRSEVGKQWERSMQPNQKADDPFGLDAGVTPTSLGGSLFQTIGRLFRKGTAR